MRSEAKISVLMGIYNCQDTLEEAVQSIQNQTYTNWELILCDDGSNDRTLDVARKLAEKDSRIIVIQNEKNIGLNKTLNRCWRISSGEYIARMDGDDICMPFRFETQVSFLKENPAYAIVSSTMIYFDESGDWGRGKAIPAPTPFDVVTGSPICHAPVMMRRECMEAVNGYSEDTRKLRVEDVDLWIKLYAAGYRCFNLEEPLYKMRNDKNAFSRRKYRYRVNSTLTRLEGCRKLHLGFSAYIKSFLPMIIGLIPGKVRMAIRKALNQGKKHI